MEKFSTALLAILLTLLLYGSVFADETQDSGNPISTMATIMLHLNHYPGEEEKMQLNDIISHSKSVEITTIASALLNMRHSVNGEDKEKLQNIMRDNSTSDQARTLAGVLLEINHHPNSSQKETLSALIH